MCCYDTSDYQEVRKSNLSQHFNRLSESPGSVTVCLTFNFDLWRRRDTGSVTVAKMQSMIMTFMYSTWDLKRLGPFVTCWTGTVGGAGVMTHWGYQEISYYSPGCYCDITPLSEPKCMIHNTETFSSNFELILS